MHRVGLILLALPAVLSAQTPDSTRTDSVAVPVYRVTERAYFTRLVPSKPDTVTLPGSTVHDTLYCTGTVCLATKPIPATGCVGVQMKPGDDVALAQNSNPAGTTFCLSAGRYLRQSILPKDGNTIRCAAGAILDGQDVTTQAIRSVGGNPDNVRLIGCAVVHYAPPAQQAAIAGGNGDPGGQTDGWYIDSVRADTNKNIGLRIGNKMKVLRSLFRWNGTLGLGGVGDDMLVQDNEISYNNPSATNLGFENGATKFVLTHRLVFRGNFLHHNKGPAFWADIGNDACLVENNRIEDNWQEGIVLEISYSCVIRNNVVKRNGLADTRNGGWPWGSCIAFHASGGAGSEVYGNTCEGNAHGLTVLQQKRGCGMAGEPACPMFDVNQRAKNINFHDNTVTCGPGSHTVAAVVTDIAGDSLLFKGSNLRYQNNHYGTLASCWATPFAFMFSWRTSAQWKGFKNDTTGTFLQ